MYDGGGSVRALADETGTITDRYTYDVFGILLTHSGSSDNAYLYRGEQYDADLGLYYLRARFMNPDSGRFWNQDTYEGRAADPASLHKYLYANADPVNGIDPTGNFTLTETQVATGIAMSVNAMAANSAANTLRMASDIFNPTGEIAEAIDDLILLNEVVQYVSMAVAVYNFGQVTITLGPKVIEGLRRLSGLGSAQFQKLYLGAVHRLRNGSSRASTDITITTERTTVVIGENMGRVKDFAGPRGYQTISDWLKTTGRTWDEAANADWVKWVKQQGHDVIDIGPDFSRRLDFKIDPTLPSARPPSSVYEAERLEMLDYSDYQKVFERTGKYSGGVPGFDP